MVLLERYEIFEMVMQYLYKGRHNSTVFCSYIHVNLLELPNLMLYLNFDDIDDISVHATRMP
jgi:hypothetical protein